MATALGHHPRFDVTGHAPPRVVLTLLKSPTSPGHKGPDMSYRAQHNLSFTIPSKCQPGVARTGGPKLQLFPPAEAMTACRVSSVPESLT
ncbi:hypothetical protein BaRGS_00039062 [Batillaria attramentaria]|uniref:Uncharacterized protein n=1 Tax=Batillaria attramentaria TaxID=370345 RepID=A0ABD0J525_9CAEN